jgi:amino acid transporter
VTDASLAPTESGGAGEKGLRAGTLGLASSIVIGVASTAPGYSLAATLGFVVAAVGLKAPAIMLLAFIPMGFIAAAYYYMNRADPDCGTTFSWVTRAMGPQMGWLGGWGIIVADVIVMANLAQIAASYSFLLVGADGLAADKFWTTFLGCLFIAAMTWICYVGIEVSAKTQYGLLLGELVALGAFTVVALWKVYFGDVEGTITPSLDWLSPFGLSASSITAGLLLAVFIYWGWDSAVTVNEEAKDASRTPGKAAIYSTVLLVLIYVIVTYAALAFGGVERLADSEDVLADLGNSVLGSPLDKLLIVAVLTSAAASTQTTILPTSRTSLSMAAKGAAPAYWGRIQPRYLTPSTSTVWMGILSVVWYAGLTVVSEDILFDSLAALGLMIAFYYGLTGYACAIYYRRQLLHSWRNFVFMGAFPVVGAVILTWVMVKSAIDLYDPANSESGDSWFGVGPPLVIAFSFLVLGFILLALQWKTSPDFFRRKPEVPTDEVARGDAIAAGALDIPDEGRLEGPIVDGGQG